LRTKGQSELREDAHDVARFVFRVLYRAIIQAKSLSRHPENAALPGAEVVSGDLNCSFLPWHRSNAHRKASNDDRSS